MRNNSRLVKPNAHNSMSTKSTNSLVLAPHLPVAAFSPQLESAFECLHRTLCRTLDTPDSIVTVASLCQQQKSYYYTIRDDLENDFGISAPVADALPIPDVSSTLKMLSAWEQAPELAQREYDVRRSEPAESLSFNLADFPISDAVGCWRYLRMWIFESARILTITRGRIARDAPCQEPRRYPWICAPHLRFTQDE